MYGYIYKTTNLINNKIYIGQKHSSKFLGNKYLGSGKRLQEALIKYGKENFKVDLVEEIFTKEQMDEREIYWIAHYDSTNNNIGYNLSTGGNVNRIMIGVNNPFYGKHHSEEVCLKASERLRGNIYLRKEDKLIRIKKDDIDRYLVAGWQVVKKTKEPKFSCVEDRLKTQSENMRGRIKINNGEITKHIKSQDLDYYLLHGWLKGSLQTSIEKMKETKQLKFKNQTKKAQIKKIYCPHSMSLEHKERLRKISQTRIKTEEEKLKRKQTIEEHGGMGFWVNDDFREKLRKAKAVLKQEGRLTTIKNYIHITNELEDKMIPQIELNKYLEIGWRKGRKKFSKKACSNISSGHLGQKAHNKNKLWVNKDGINKTVTREELEIYLNAGWQKGMLKRK